MNDKENDIILKLNRVADQLMSGKRKFDLDVGDIGVIEDEGLRQLAQKFVHICQEYRDSSQFIVDLSRGKLNTPSPQKNMFVGPFKQLHSELRHLTWQIQEIAKGDYSQKVSFSGDFADAINKMIIELRERRALWLQVRENEAKLLQYTEELDASNRTKDKLFSIIAHDLKGHFNVLLGFGQMLALEVNETRPNIENIREYSTLMHTSAAGAFSLLTNMLDWARLQSDRIVVTPEDLDLNDIISENIDIARGVAENKGVSLNHIDGGDCPLYSDRAIINTVLRNLIGNAIKYTPRGGKIIVRVGAKDDEYVVSVQDNGVGIPKDVLDKLFEGEDIRSTPGTADETGTGLGLSLCKDFVEMLGGKIWAKSIPECGAVFSFSIRKNLSGEQKISTSVSS